MVKPLVVVALGLVPQLACTEGVTLNGVVADVNVEKPDARESTGTLRSRFTIEVQGNTLELERGKPIVWFTKQAVVKEATLAKDTPIKIGTNDFVLAAGSSIELGFDGSGVNLRARLVHAKLAKDAEVRLPGRAPLMAKAADTPRNIRFGFPDRVAWFYLAQQTQLGAVKALDSTEVEVGPTPSSIQLGSATSKTLELTFFGQTVEAQRAGFESDRLRYVDVFDFVQLGDKRVPVGRVLFKADGAVESVTTAKIDDDAGGFMPGTTLHPNADGTGLALTAAPKAVAAPVVPVIAPAKAAAAAPVARPAHATKAVAKKKRTRAK